MNEKYKEISVNTLKHYIDNKYNVCIIDVRELFEIKIASISEAIHIPMNEIPENLDKLKIDDEIIVMCKSGVRSAKVCEFLYQNNYKNISNLVGGINAWSIEIDKNVKLY